MSEDRQMAKYIFGTSMQWNTMETLARRQGSRKTVERAPSLSGQNICKSIYL